eukprot:333584-Pleurochrysis_carterae.AAC.1
MKTSLGPIERCPGVERASRLRRPHSCLTRHTLLLGLARTRLGLCLRSLAFGLTHADRGAFELCACRSGARVDVRLGFGRAV